MIASEDVARQTAKADAASAFLVAGDRRLRSDPRSVLANFDAIRQGPANEVRFFGADADTRDRQQRFDHLAGDLGDLHGTSLHLMVTQIVK